MNDLDLDKEGQNKSWTSDYWSEEAFSYDKDRYEIPKGYPALVLRNKYMMELMQNNSGKALDIGCGPGYTLLTLLEKDFNVWGVDISEEMVNRARINLEKEGIGEDRFSLAVGDVEKLDFSDEMFDTVVCSGVIEYIQDDSKSIAELNRVLCVGGELLLTVRNKYCIQNFLYELLDRRKFFTPIKNFLKKTYLKRISRDYSSSSTPMEDIMYWKHSPSALKKKLQQYGFETGKDAYFHFLVFPMPFNVIFGFIAIPVGLRLERFSRSWLGLLLAGGYIVRATKTNNLTM